MERKSLSGVSLLNSYSAAADVVTSGNVTKITGLPPIITPGMRVVEVSVDTGVAETTQVINITLAATIAQERNYSLNVNFIDDKYENHTSENIPVRYRSPAALTGSAATDKHNAYISLAYKMNSISRISQKLTAYALFTLAYNTQTANYTVGAVLTGATSGAKALIIADADGGATGTLTLAAIPGYSTIFTTGEIIADNNGTPGSATAGASTLGVGLRLVDKAGYYPVNGYRGGATIVYASEGFVTSDIVTSTAAVYAKYTAAQLTSSIPTRDLFMSNVILGDVNFGNLNNAPTAGLVYNAITIKVRNRLSGSPIADASGSRENHEAVYLLLLNAGDADYAATLSAIQALVAVA